MAGKIGRYIPDHIYRALLARSGNRCAFTGCTKPLVNAKNVYEAQLCHIESVSHKKQRYNPKLTKEEVNGYNNLMFMCLKHHNETNDEIIFPTDVMRKMKYDHESKYVESPFHFDLSHLFIIQKESEDYWLEVEKANNDEHIFPELRMEINTNSEYEELNIDITKTVNSIEELIDMIDEKDKNNNWEVFNLGFPNHINKIKILLDQMRIKYFEAHIKSNPSDMESKSKLDTLRKEFLETARNIGHID